MTVFAIAFGIWKFGDLLNESFNSKASCQVRDKQIVTPLCYLLPRLRNKR